MKWFLIVFVSFWLFAEDALMSFWLSGRILLKLNEFAIETAISIEFAIIFVSLRLCFASESKVSSSIECPENSV